MVAQRANSIKVFTRQNIKKHKSVNEQGKIDEENEWMFLQNFKTLRERKPLKKVEKLICGNGY